MIAAASEGNETARMYTNEAQAAHCETARQQRVVRSEAQALDSPDIFDLMHVQPPISCHMHIRQTGLTIRT